MKIFYLKINCFHNKAQLGISIGRCSREEPRRGKTFFFYKFLVAKNCVFLVSGTSILSGLFYEIVAPVGSDKISRKFTKPGTKYDKSDFFWKSLNWTKTNFVRFPLNEADMIKVSNPNISRTDKKKRLDIFIWNSKKNFEPCFKNLVFKKKGRAEVFRIDTLYQKTKEIS